MLVSTIREGGREVARTPPSRKKIASAPTSPQERSQNRALIISRRVGAGTLATEANTLLFNSGERLIVVLAAVKDPKMLVNPELQRAGYDKRDVRAV